jgi:hypothetical protein
MSYCVTIGTAVIGRTTSTQETCTAVRMAASPWPTLAVCLVGLAAVTEAAESACSPCRTAAVFVVYR